MKTRTTRYLPLVLISALLAACDSDDGPIAVTPVPAPEPAPEPVTVDYEIEVTNLTAGQPLSPIAVIAHGEGFQLFAIGDTATAGMEQLAEGGDNSELLAEAEGASAVISTLSGDGPVGPGGSQTLMLSVDENDITDLQVSLVTMLVNTNDAITAARGIDLSSLASGESVMVRTLSYDSGTEANTETSGTIPGPVDGGEGFNAARDDIADAIRGHSGVVTQDDGAPDSVLNAVHRWDNPVTAVSVRRL